MRIIYFDTETTGLSPGPLLGGMYFGKICQLTYIILENEIPTAKNFFFKVDYIEPASTQVTGLTPQKLAILSGGRAFSDDAEEIYTDFASADFVVSHNFGFDQKFMDAEFRRIGKSFDFKRSICSMRSTCSFLKIPGKRTLYKLPSLAELSAFFGVSDREVIAKTKELFSSNSVAHDARFDTVKLMMSVERAKKVCPALVELN